MSLSTVYLKHKKALTETNMKLFTLCVLLLGTITTLTHAQNCVDLIMNGVGNNTSCRVFPGPENCTDICAASGTCFDEGFCCPRGFELCGIGFATISACYDPNVFTCCGTFSSPGGTAPVLCPAVTNPNRTSACIRAGSDRPGCAPTNPNEIPPPFPPNQCGQRIFNPEEYVCLGGMSLCPRTAPLACNEDCFNPQRYTCTADYRFVEGTPLQFFQLCPIQAPFLCGTHCYDRNRYICYSHRLAGRTTDMLCPIEAPLICGESQCFNETFARCDNGTLVMI